MGAAVGCDYRDAIGIEVNADGYWEEEKRLGDIAKLKHIKETGYVYVGDAIYYIHKYLNTESIEECLVGDNYFLYMLAIMDRRVGKRIVATIEEILPYCNQLR